MKWSVAELARKSAVSRPLVYRYFGSSKEEILRGALKHIASIIYEGVDDIVTARMRLMEMPSAIIFYQKWRTSEGWITEEFIHIEKKFQGKIRKLFPKASAAQAVHIHALMHGLVTAPFITPAETAAAFENLARSLSR